MKLVEEPLLHFLLAAALLFAAYSWLDRRGEKADFPAVRITAAEAEWLANAWTRQRRRQPTESELGGLITDYLRQQLLAREARELGLDENDTVITSRLAQKMEFLIEDTTRLAEPDEGELLRLYDTHRARYHAPARLSFMQIFFRTEDGALRGIDQVSTDSAADLGDASLLAGEYLDTDAATITNVFGRDFAARVFALAPGRWRGPLRSVYGFHLVRVTERHAEQPRAFGDVRARVLEDWRRSERDEAEKLLLAELLAKYDVLIEKGLQPLVERTMSAHAGTMPAHAGPSAR